MRYRFFDQSLNLTSQKPSCECRSKSNDSADPITLRQVNENNRRFYDTSTVRSPLELEQGWRDMEAASRDKIARALAKDSPTEGLRAMNDANRSFWAAKGVR